MNIDLDLEFKIRAWRTISRSKPKMNMMNIGWRSWCKHEYPTIKIICKRKDEPTLSTIKSWWWTLTWTLWWTITPRTQDEQYPKKINESNNSWETHQQSLKLETIFKKLSIRDRSLEIIARSSRYGFDTNCWVGFYVCGIIRTWRSKQISKVPND